MRYLLILPILFLMGCSTVAYRDNGETLTIKGCGEAHWSDGTSIKGEPIVKFPQLPPVKLEQ